MELEKALIIGGRKCWTMWLGDLREAAAVPVVYLPTSDDFPKWGHALAEGMAPMLTDGQCRPFLLAAFASSDWNREYSPWPAEPLFKKADAFAGEGGSTLRWLLDSFMPAVQGTYLDNQAQQPYIAGYSLAGLFALWSLYENTAFVGCASCSGSLWYDGWMAYISTRRLKHAARVYVSLGDREGKARNPRMASVDEATQETVRRLADDPNVTDSAFQWNEGGHFDDMTGRLTKALLWLMRA